MRFRNTASASAGTPPRPATSNSTIASADCLPIPWNDPSIVFNVGPTRVSRIRAGTAVFGLPFGGTYPLTSAMMSDAAFV